jgi:hypothetical protein
MSPSVQPEGSAVPDEPAVIVREMVVGFVKLPDVPEMVTVAGPVVAVESAVNVTMLVLVAGFVPNATVTPLGKPDADKVTPPLNPFSGVTVIVLVPLAPCAKLRLFGEADSVKFGAGAGAVTVRESVVGFDRLPDVPVMVTVPVPVVAVLLAVRVSVLVPVAGFGLNTAVTPLGKPEVAKVTPELKPFTGLTVIVLPPLVPCTIVKLLGEAESVKFGGGAGAFTVSESVVGFVKLPDVPVMVTLPVPVVAALLAVSVSVLVPVAGFGLNTAVTPLGKPEAAKVTPELKPFTGLTVIVLPPLVPCTIVKLLGAAESEKFGAGGGGVVMETLSKVAVAREVVVPPFTAKPMKTF